MPHSGMGITSNYSLINEVETYTTEAFRHTAATLNIPTVEFEGICLSVYKRAVMTKHVKAQLQNQTKTYDPVFAWMICRHSLK